MKQITLLFIAFFLALVPWKNACVAQETVNPYGTHTLKAVTMNEDGTYPTNRIDFSTPLGRTSTGAAWTMTVTTTKAQMNENSGATIIHPLFIHSNLGEISTALTFYQFIDQGINISKGGLYSTTATSVELDGTGDLPVGTPIEIKLILAGEYIFRIVTAGELSSFKSSLLSMTYDEVGGISAGYPADVKVEIKNTAETVCYVAQKSLSFTTPLQTSSTANYVSIEAAAANVSYVLTGANPEAFKLSEATYPPWNAATGGRLEIIYQPPTLGTHTAQIEISSPGMETQTVSLSGTCAFPDIDLSPGITNSPADTWYYIYNPWRAVQDAGYLLTDNGSQLVQDVLYPTTQQTLERRRQLWKVVQQSEGRYVFVNYSTGRVIDCTSASDNPAEFPVLTTLMTTTNVNNAPSAFRFYQGTGWNTGYWIINCWEEEASINKTLANNLYCLYGNPESGDLGNGVAFFKEADRALLVQDWDDRSKPKLSTTDAEYWYRMQFRNAAITQSVVDKGKNNKLGQAAIADAEDTSVQYWRLTGTSFDECKIESYAGYEIASNGSDRYISVNKGEGDTFRLEANTSPENAEQVFWQLYNTSATCNNQYYIANASNTEATGQDANNGGNWLYFNPVSPDPALIVESEALDFDQAPLNEATSLSFGVMARSLTGSDAIAYAVEGTDQAAFVATPGAGWSTKQGGTLNIAFTPTQAKTYSATLKLTAAGEVKTVALTGTGTSNPILSISPLELAFGTTATGMVSEAKNLTVSILNATGDVTYTKKNGEAAFEIDATDWTPASGGTLRIAFKPTEAKAYSETLAISSPGAQTKEVVLTGTGEMLDLPVTLSTAGSEVWYYLQFDKRTGTIIQDMGKDKMLETRPPMRGVNSQLWKVMATGVSGQYRIISKNGNEIAYTPATLGEVAANRFYATDATTYTYDFVKREDDGWQIYCNDENSYVNKLYPGSYLQIPQIGKFADNPDDGSSIAFIPEAEIGFKVPRFSTETETWWYRIQFLSANPVTGANIVQDEGEYLDLSLFEEIDWTAQYWKLVGSWENFKIVAFSGSEFGADEAGAHYQTVPPGMGNEFKLAWNISTFSAWRLYDKTVDRIVNQRESLYLYGYSESGTGYSAVDFLPIGFTGIQHPDTDDEVTATKYYTLFGIEVQQPAVTGIYIVKNTYASGKTQTVKKLFIIK